METIFDGNYYLNSQISVLQSKYKYIFYITLILIVISVIFYFFINVDKKKRNKFKNKKIVKSGKRNKRSRR